MYNLSLAILLILFLVILCRYAVINLQMIKSIKEFKNACKGEINLNSTKKLLHICVPCLREQSIIECTLDELISATYPVRNKVKIYVVTTQKEISDKERFRSHINEFTKALINNVAPQQLHEKFAYLFSLDEIKQIKDTLNKGSFSSDFQIDEYISNVYVNKPSTYEIVDRYIKERQLEAQIVLLNYPRSKCCMASQLNYCYKWILKNRAMSASEYFMVYNADCMPNPNTFKSLFYQMEKNENVRAFQLIRAYTLNYQDYRGIIGYFLRASALYQTRWSFGAEYPMYKRYFQCYHSSTWRSYYMIGHGMTFSLNLLDSINGFHEETNLEDLYTGYVLSYLREPVLPVLTVENTLNPSSINSWIKQKMVWFSGMYDVENYPKYLTQTLGSNIDSRWARNLRIQFYVRDTLPWLIGPSLVIVYLLLSFLVYRPLFWSGAILVAINSAVCAIYLPIQLRTLGVLEDNLRHDFCVTIGVIFYSLLRNIPSIIYVVRRFIHKSMDKYKTER